MKNFTDYQEWLVVCHAQGWVGPSEVIGHPRLQQFVSDLGVQATWNGDFTTGNANVIDAEPVIDSGDAPVVDSTGQDVTANTSQVRRHRHHRRRRKRQANREFLATQTDEPVDTQGGDEIK